MKYFSVLLIAILFATSCSEEEPEIAIEPALQGIFDVFVDEAAARGVLVDFESIGLTARLQTIGQPRVEGFCRGLEEGGREIVIDRNFWTQALPIRQELLVFHELGHCVLGRDHFDEIDANGNCVSIMNTFIDNCEDSFLSTTRTQYLDELFGRS